MRFKTRTPPNKLPIPSKDDLIKNFYEVGEAKKLTKIYNCSYDTIHRWFKFYNLSAKELKFIPDEKIIELYKKYDSFSKISKELKIGFIRIGDTLRKHNIPINVFGKYSKYKCNDLFFSEYNELSSYWAGFVAADGHISKPKAERQKQLQLHLELKHSDKCHLESFKTLLNSDRPIFNCERVKFNKVSKTAKLSVVSQKLCDDLKEKFNVTDYKKSYILEPPYNLPKQYEPHYIRGLIDGDGTFYISKECYGFALYGTKKILEWVQNIFIYDLGLNKLKIRKRKNTCYELAYSGTNNVVKIRNYLYKDATVCLGRKFDIVKNITTKRMHVPQKLTLKHLYLYYNKDINKLSEIYEVDNDVVVNWINKYKIS